MLVAFRGITGDFDWGEQRPSSFSLQSVLFLEMTVLGTIIVMNLFIALLSEVYSTAVEQSSAAWNARTNSDMAQQIQRAFNRVRHGARLDYRSDFRFKCARSMTPSEVLTSIVVLVVARVSGALWSCRLRCKACCVRRSRQRREQELASRTLSDISLHPASKLDAFDAFIMHQATLLEAAAAWDQPQDMPEFARWGSLTRLPPAVEAKVVRQLMPGGSFQARVLQFYFAVLPADMDLVHPLVTYTTTLGEGGDGGKWGFESPDGLSPRSRQRACVQDGCGGMGLELFSRVPSPHRALPLRHDDVATAISESERL